jgi:hypothetical protein
MPNFLNYINLDIEKIILISIGYASTPSGNLSSSNHDKRK